MGKTGEEVRAQNLFGILALFSCFSRTWLALGMVTCHTRVKHYDTHGMYGGFGAWREKEGEEGEAGGALVTQKGTKNWPKLCLASDPEGP